MSFEPYEHQMKCDFQEQKLSIMDKQGGGFLADGMGMGS